MLQNRRLDTDNGQQVDVTQSQQKIPTATGSWYVKRANEHCVSNNLMHVPQSAVQLSNSYTENRNKVIKHGIAHNGIQQDVVRFGTVHCQSEHLQMQSYFKEKDYNLLATNLPSYKSDVFDVSTSPNLKLAVCKKPNSLLTNVISQARCFNNTDHVF